MLARFVREQSADKPFVGLLELVERCGHEAQRWRGRGMIDAGALDFCSASRRR